MCQVKDFLFPSLKYNDSTFILKFPSYEEIHNVGSHSVQLTVEITPQPCQNEALIVLSLDSGLNGAQECWMNEAYKGKGREKVDSTLLIRALIALAEGREVFYR